MTKQCEDGAHIAMIFSGSSISFFLTETDVFQYIDHSVEYRWELTPGKVSLANPEVSERIQARNPYNKKYCRKITVTAK